MTRRRSSATGTTCSRPGSGGGPSAKTAGGAHRSAGRTRASTRGPASWSPTASGRHELRSRHGPTDSPPGGTDAESRRPAHDPDSRSCSKRALGCSIAWRQRVDGGIGAALAAAANGLRDQARHARRAADQRARRARRRPRSPTVPDPTDLTRTKSQPLWVDRGERAQKAAWYELFPRSEGGLAPATKRLARDRRDGLRRRVPAADPPDRPRRSARVGTTRWTPARTTRAARGPSASPRAATPPSTPSSARSTTSTRSSTGATRSAWRSRSTTRSSARPTTPG